MGICVVPYTPTYKSAWDDMVQASTNGTFLFYRDYMEYHSDRFRDASLLAFDDRKGLVAILPANRDGDVVTSHQGLSYGGFVSSHATVPLSIRIFGETLQYLARAGVSRLVYKAIPDIYLRRPSGEAAYALTCFAARLVRRDVLSVVIPAQGLSFQQRRWRSIRKAQEAGVSVALSQDFTQFWPILERNLQEVYGARPVHSLAEIRLLHDRFPDNIKLFSAYHRGDMIAGVVIYESARVAHVQYVGTGTEGRRLRAVDMVYHWLLETYYRTKPYFDFGNSVGTDAWGLNLGVLEFKESFGGRAVMQDFFELDVTPGMQPGGPPSV
jgi:hypothetical protein